MKKNIKYLIAISLAIFACSYNITAQTKTLPAKLTIEIAACEIEHALLLFIENSNDPSGYIDYSEWTDVESIHKVYHWEVPDNSKYYKVIIEGSFVCPIGFSTANINLESQHLYGGQVEFGIGQNYNQYWFNYESIPSTYQKAIKATL